MVKNVIHLFNRLSFWGGILWGIPLFLVAACTTPSAQEQLEQIATLVDSIPQTARLQLDSIDSGSLNREDAALYALLKTQADYKCFVPLTSDSLIRTAVDYYGDKKSYRSAMAAYYLGCVYSDLEEDEEAVRAYLKAQSLFPDTTVRYYALCSYNMGKHYRNKRMDKEAMEQYGKLLHYALLNNSHEDWITATFHIAEIDLHQQSFEKAEKEFLSIVNDTSKIPVSILCACFFQLGKIAFNDCDYEKAEEYFDKNIMLKQSNRNSGKSYYYKGRLSEHKGKADSAYYYYKKSLVSAEDVYLKYSIYQSLINWSNHTNRKDSILLYVHEFEILADSINHLERRADIDAVERDHSLEVYKREADEKGKVRIAIEIIIIICSILIAVAVILWNSRKRKGQNQLNNGEVQIESAIHSTGAGQIQKSYDFLCTLKQDLETSAETFYQTDIASELLRYKNNKDFSMIRISTNDKVLLSETLLNCFSKVVLELQNHYKSLGIGEITYCLYFYVGCTNNLIALLESVEVASLRSRKKRIKGKIAKEVFEIIFKTKTESNVYIDRGIQ